MVMVVTCLVTVVVLIIRVIVFSAAVATVSFSAAVVTVLLLEAVSNFARISNKDVTLKVVLVVVLVVLFRLVGWLILENVNIYWAISCKGQSFLSNYIFSSI